MRLLKLEITGFKSFQNRATLVFPKGITAVVGPNGCGKSNIVDALRWVMGEQSVKQLRGKSMEDLIFSGADGKQPLNMAEVSLLIDNSDTSGAGPEPSAPSMAAYTEIMVTRRLYRSGESVYMINRQACRLKDIHNLFLGSGTGKNSFAVIQQGNIGALTDASPEDRRYFIEDAADITKYKERKKDTLSRIRTTRENLTRISDIMAELKKRLSTLERQAAKAKKYKEYKTRVKTLEISIALWNFETISRDIREKTAAHDKATEADRMLDASILAVESLQNTVRQQLADKKQVLSGLTQNRFDVQRSLDKKETDLDVTGREIRRLVREIKEVRKKRLDVSEKNEALSFEIETERSVHGDTDGQITEKEKGLALESEKLETLRKERDDLEKERKELNQSRMILAGEEAKCASVLAGAEQRKTGLARRLRQVDEELYLAEKDLSEARRNKEKTEKDAAEAHRETDVLFREKAQAGEALKTARLERDGYRSDLRRFEIELSAHSSRFATLKAMEDQFGWYESGVKSLLTRMKEKGDTAVHGVLADRLRPARGFEKPVEALLGDVLQYILVDSSDKSVELVRDLESHNDGRCGFIALESLQDVPETDVPDGASALIDRIEFKKEDERLVRSVINNAMICPDLETAVDLRKKHLSTSPMVTLDGEVITERGLIVSKSTGNGGSIFEKKNELDEIGKAVSEWEAKKNTLAGETMEAENRVNQALLDESRLSGLLAQAEKDRTRMDKELFMAAETLRQAERKRDVLGAEQERLQGDAEDIDSDIEKKTSDLASVRRKIRENEERLSRQGESAQGASDTMERQSSVIIQLRMELARMTAERDNRMSSLKRLEHFLDESSKRLSRLMQEESGKKEQTRTHSSERNRFRADREELKKLITSLSAETEARRGELSLVEKELKEKESEKSHLEKMRHREQETMRILDLELSQLKIRRENITARIEEKYHHRINQYKLEFDENEHDRIDVSTLNIPFLEAELEDLNTRIIQLGDVNLASIAEYDEVKERHDFMEIQEKDLVKSLEDLETIIEKINGISQERFLATFDAINEKLATLFPTLFEGGSAWLSLTDPAKPLETGVELMIQPPGKKLTRLSLLSGGEKALSAIAFVFSIFLIKPSSFCIMDEIDAPLDDANVTRFNNMVRHIGEQSQILVITHNKVTMEFADILFGVTMEKKGVSRIVSVSLTEAGEVEPGRQVSAESLAEPSHNG
jgi:chromosome segregation protein